MRITAQSGLQHDIALPLKRGRVKLAGYWHFPTSHLAGRLSLEIWAALSFCSCIWGCRFLRLVRKGAAFGTAHAHARISWGILAAGVWCVPLQVWLCFWLFVTQNLASGFCAPSTQERQGLVSLLWCSVTEGHQPLSLSLKCFFTAQSELFFEHVFHVLYKLFLPPAYLLLQRNHDV